MRGELAIVIAVHVIACGRWGFEAPPMDGSTILDGNPFVDTDGDNLFDDVDNCITVPNTDQHNEDGDAWGDVCDRCPHIFSETDSDGDADGVGDDCDPRPGNSNDRLDRFFPFHVQHGEVLADAAATWLLQDDMVSYLGTGSASFTVSDPRSHGFVEIGGEVIGASSSSDLKILVGRTSSTVFIGCGFDEEPGSSTIEIEQETPNLVLASSPRMDALVPGPFVVRVDSDPSSSNINCSGIEGGKLTEVTVSAASLTPGQVGVGLRGVQVQIRYLIIIAHD